MRAGSAIIGNVYSIILWSDPDNDSLTPLVVTTCVGAISIVRVYCAMQDMERARGESEETHRNVAKVLSREED